MAKKKKQYSQIPGKKNYSVHLGSTKNATLLKVCLGYLFLLLTNLDQEFTFFLPIYFYFSFYS